MALADVGSGKRIKTFRQYAINLRREKVIEYQISAKEAIEFYPDHHIHQEWWKYVMLAFESGADFTPAAVRSLTDTQLWELRRSTRGLSEELPRRYLRVSSKEDQR